ncbi:MMPL family transporter [Nocardioides jishulii]|uniref:MMPL family transporter n=1 Tax=Nocardioides jishulii TaxID=2575440 RepID=A0A4U2YSE0_9ACTN|nr:MMPL family transporter [Nocardioides jishulii]QCX26141.1 MMPL family transporter [Nocardioides jishulii]TKI64060.1 MMPL family transporter [Nocardioides jishulii]
MSTPAPGTNRVTRFIAGRRTAWIVALLPLLFAGWVISLGEAEAPTDPSLSLPDGYGITQATDLEERLTTEESSAAILLWTADSGELSEQQLGELRKAVGKGPFVVAEDRSAVYTVVPVDAQDSSEIREQVKDLRAEVKADAPDGVSGSVTGPAAIQSDFSEVFAGADVRLLLATASIVAILLIITYRSPVLWIVPLVVVAVADRLAAISATQIMQNVDFVAWDQSTVGILSVLVFGAGTDYALLLISRYRDELKREESRHVAMARALRRTFESVAFSASTVVLGVLTLLLSVFPNTRGLGLACAIGVLIAATFAVVVLPAALVVFGRWLFWPMTPKVGDTQLVDGKGFWHKVGRRVDSRPRTFVIGTLALLAVLMVGFSQVKVGLEESEQFLDTPPALVAAERLGESYPAGTSDPAQVLTEANPGEVLAAVKKVEGVTSAMISDEGDGVAMIDAVTAAAPGTDEAKATVERIRSAVDGFDKTYVGGGDAELIDVADASNRDRMLILPVIVLLVLGALILLLRSLITPVLLVITVVATYAAAMGISWWVFTFVFGFPAIDQSVPLMAFLFLVALGVDYNIFLITRAREEALKFGNRVGMLRALTATGGVITSAGILLAAVFAVLGVLPLVVLAQLGIIIFFGVLLDTLLVRTVLVPALAISLGDKFWWPRKLPTPAAGEGDRDGSTPLAGTTTVAG